MRSILVSIFFCSPSVKSADWRAAINSTALSTDKVYEALDKLKTAYPSVVTKETIGKSVLGKPIFAYKIFSPSDPPVPAVSNSLLISGLRGGQAASIATTVNFVGTFLEEAVETENLYILKSRTLYFVPVANPDAYDTNSVKNAQKTCSSSEKNGGVDLARNFDSHWSQFSPDGCSAQYNGPAAFSEPETQAIRDLVKAHKFVAALNVEVGPEDILTYPLNWNETERIAVPHDVYYDGLQTKMKFAKSGPTSRTMKTNTVGEITDWLYQQAVLGASMQVITSEREWVLKNFMRIRYWLYKNGPEILTRFMEQGNGVGVRFRNSGLHPTSGSLKIVLDFPGTECGPYHCKKVNKYRVYDWSSNGVPSYHWSATLDFPNSGSSPAGKVRGFICTVELGLNCKCWNLIPGYDVVPYGTISTYTSFPEMCKAGGVTDFVPSVGTPQLAELSANTPVTNHDKLSPGSIVIPLIICFGLLALAVWLKHNLTFGEPRHGSYIPSIQLAHLDNE